MPIVWQPCMAVLPVSLLWPYAGLACGQVLAAGQPTAPRQGRASDRHDCTTPGAMAQLDQSPHGAASTIAPRVGAIMGRPLPQR